MKLRLRQALPLLACCALFFFGSLLHAETYRDINGVPRAPLQEHSVLIFFWHDCPICNSYATEINRLARQYTHFFFYIVQVDPDLSAPAARRHAADYSLTPPVLLDPRHQLVRLTGAKVTPEAFVLGANQTVLYHGRIDNLYPSLSRRLPEATVHDLAMALDSIAAGRPATSSEPAIGCLIQ